MTKQSTKKRATKKRPTKKPTPEPKRPTMRFSQFADFVNGFTGERPSQQRLGQWAFNLLYSAYPEIADYLRGSQYDPFHQSEKIPDFLCALLQWFVVMDDPGK